MTETRNSDARGCINGIRGHKCDLQPMLKRRWHNIFGSRILAFSKKDLQSKAIHTSNMASPGWSKRKKKRTTDRRSQNIVSVSHLTSAQPFFTSERGSLVTHWVLFGSVSNSTQICIERALFAKCNNPYFTYRYKGLKSVGVFTVYGICLAAKDPWKSHIYP